MRKKLIVLAVLLCAAVSGQNRGSISGEVTDTSGALVPAATVRVNAPAIGLMRETTTNDTGFFTVPTLPTGDYEIRVEMNGFKTLTRSGVRLDGGEAVSLKLQLEVGPSTDRVEVTTDAPLVETSNGEVSRLVT